MVVVVERGPSNVLTSEMASVLAAIIANTPTEMTAVVAVCLKTP
jgi:hypothetical protein